LIFHREKERKETKGRRDAVVRDTTFFKTETVTKCSSSPKKRKRKCRRWSTDRRHIFVRKPDRKFSGCETS
jgi:hypothetical protein